MRMRKSDRRSTNVAMKMPRVPSQIAFSIAEETSPPGFTRYDPLQWLPPTQHTEFRSPRRLPRRLIGLGGPIAFPELRGERLPG